jgi:hypothetical protein
VNGRVSQSVKGAMIMTIRFILWIDSSTYYVRTRKSRIGIVAVTPELSVKVPVVFFLAVNLSYYVLKILLHQ